MRTIFSRACSRKDVIYTRQTEPTPIKQTGNQTIKESREAAEEGEERLTYLANDES